MCFIFMICPNCNKKELFKDGDKQCKKCSDKNGLCLHCMDEPSYVGHGATYYGHDCYVKLFGDCPHKGMTEFRGKKLECSCQ